MMSRRLELHSLLENLLGSTEVYFQAPESKKMQYPCIIYRINNGNTQFANNKPYIFEKRYQVIVVDKNPDSLIPDKIAQLPRCIFDRSYATDNLNHFAFNLYY
jgi:hypothetical protein